MGFAGRFAILTIFVAALIGTAFYLLLTFVKPICGTDLDAKFPFPESDWVIREVASHCSGLDSELDISAVNKKSGQSAPLFFISGDASTALTFDKNGVVLLVDKFADIKQLGGSFGRFSAGYTRATDSQIKSAPSLVPVR